MNNKQKFDYKTKKIYGIPDKDYFFDNWIVIFFAIFWFTPIGIVLLLRKISLHRRNLFKSGNIAIGFGILFAIVGYAFKYALDEVEFYAGDVEIIIFLMLFNFILSVILLTIGILTKLKAKRYRKYISLVVNYKTSDLTEISNKMKLSRNRVLKDLDNLISTRYLERYVIDLNQNKIYLPEDVLEKIKQEEEERKYHERYTRPVQCRNCGANNLLTDKIGRCEYCNSYIK